VLQALPTPTGLDRWTTPGQPRGQSRLATCVIVVTALHAAALAALVQLRAPPTHGALEFPGIPLIIEQIEPLADAALSPEPPAPAALSAPHAVSITTAAPAAPMAPFRAAARRSETAPSLAARQPVPAAAPGQATQQAGRQNPAATPSPAPLADDPAALAALEARIDGAVQAASSMPEAAKRQHREGRARLRFTYLDGTVDNVALVESSQSKILDDAALAAIRRAHYPPVPAIARGKRLNLLVWIDFRLSPEG
jgi:periplasmic protein TonB